MITFITYHDGTEPFKTMATELKESVDTNTREDCVIVQVKPNGGPILSEFYGAMYPIFSQAIQDGPVVVLDADCFVQKPIDDLFEKDFAIAAIYRGKVSVSQGRQDFLGSFIGFHPYYSNLVRELWMKWISNIFGYAKSEHELIAATRYEDMKRNGWFPCWYSGQTAYNDMLFEAEEKKIPILRLDRKEYAARPGTKDAYVIHHKGSRKLK